MTVLYALPSPPKNWSSLSWQQLLGCWEAKIRYSGNPDVARAAAFLSVMGCEVCSDDEVRYSEDSGEALYILRGDDGRLWTVTPRALSQLAKQSLSFLDYPYGDPGTPPIKDEKGNVVEEAHDPVPGYVNPNFRDALALPEEEVVFCGKKMYAGSEWQQKNGEEQYADIRREWAVTDDRKRRNFLRKSWRRMNDDERGDVLGSSLFVLRFSLPQVACTNITWQQYRSLQAVVPELFSEDISEERAVALKAQFLAHILVPSTASATVERFVPTHVFRYDAERAEQTLSFWQERLVLTAANILPVGEILFHICLQCYQTSLLYYEKVYPLLFSSGSKDDPLQDALTGEVGTINTIMKYQGYREPQQVYNTELPIIFDVLNTMTKEAKEIEKMNNKMKRKKP